VRGRHQWRLIVRVDGRNTPRRGEHVNIKPRSGHVHAFPALTGERL
jgi:hypothetical protein